MTPFRFFELPGSRDKEGYLKSSLLSISILHVFLHENKALIGLLFLIKVMLTKYYK